MTLILPSIPAAPRVGSWKCHPWSGLASGCPFLKLLDGGSCRRLGQVGGCRDLSTSTGRSCLSLKPEPAMRRRKLWTRHAGWTLPCTSCAAWGQESSESPVGLRKMGSIIPHAEGFKASAIQQRVLSKHLNGTERKQLFQRAFWGVCGFPGRRWWPWKNRVSSTS